MPQHYSAARVRRGAAVFFTGKAITAVLTLVALALVARILPLAEYGAYATAVATMELALALSSCGIDWVAARAIPEIREKGSGRMLERYVWRLGALQAAIICAISFCLWMSAGFVAAAVGQATFAPVLEVYALVMAVEGMGRLARDQMLGVLLHQKEVQLSQLSRIAVFVALLVSLGPGAQAIAVAWLDLAAAGAGFAAGALLLYVRLSAERRRSAADPRWRMPPTRQFVQLARNAYGSYLFSLTYSGQVITLLVARWLGAEQVALFGFARQLSDQIRRYLPADLFMALIRPAMVASYTNDGGAETLIRQARVLLIGSLLVLSPLLVFVFAFGGEALGFLGGTSFERGGWVLTGLVCMLVPFSARRVLELVANIALRSEIVLKAGAALCFVPLAVIALLAAGSGLMETVAVMILGELIFVFLVLRGLSAAGLVFLLPMLSLTKLAIAIAVCTVLLVIFPVRLWVSGQIAGLAIGAMLSVVLFVAAATLLRTLEASDRTAFSRALGRQWNLF